MLGPGAFLVPSNGKAKVQRRLSMSTIYYLSFCPMGGTPFLSDGIIEALHYHMTVALLTPFAVVEHICSGGVTHSKKDTQKIERLDPEANAWGFLPKGCINR